MKPRMRVLGWFIAIATFNGMGCGGGDDSIISPGAAFDGAAEADVARPDGGHPGDADAGAAKDGNDARPGADAPGTPDSKPDGPFVDGPSADAPKDASLVDRSDARETSGGDSDGDAQSQPESSADSDAAAYDADANGPDAQDAAQADADAFTAVDAAPDVTPDASTDASDEQSNPDATDSDGSPPEMVHWTIEASPPECSADPSAVSCGDGDFFQVAAVTACPTSLSGANLYFQAGAIPTAGTFTVLPAASLADAFAVAGTEVAVQLTRSGNPTESWWGQSGTVNVQVIGNRLFMDFSGISAFEESNHSRTTTLGGFLICAP